MTVPPIKSSQKSKDIVENWWRWAIPVIVGGMSFFVAGCSIAPKSDGYSGIGAESIAPEKLATYAAPPLPAEISRKLQSFQDLVAPGMGILHPNRKQIFFGWRVTGVPQVWRLEQGRFPVQMTGGEDPTFLQKITPDGKYLVLSRDRNGEENPGLYLQPTSGGELEVIQHKPKIQTFYEGLSLDGRWLYYRSNDRDPSSYSIYRFSMKNKTSELIFEGQGNWAIADHLPNGTLLLRKALSNVAAEFYLLPAGAKTPTPLIGQGENEDYSMAFWPAKDEYLVKTNKFGEHQRLYRWKAGKFTPLTPGTLKWDVDSFGFSYDNRFLTYSVNENGFTKAHILRTSNLKPVAMPSFPGAAHVDFGSWTWDSRTVMIGVETSQAPRVSYSWDIETGRRTQWVMPSTPEIDTRRFVTSRTDHYPAQDGTRIPVLVYEPPQCGSQATNPCPVVIHFHGGPEAQSQPGFDLTAQLFVSRGFVYLEPNVRGSDGYGKTWINADNQERRKNVISDIPDAGKWARQVWSRSGKNPKVGIMGGSYGGYSTLYAMTYFAGTYDAGVSNVGMSNLLTFIQNTAPYRRALRTPEYGDPTIHAEVMRELSPITWLDRVKSPLLIIQGANDPRVPAGEAIQMYEAMRKKGLDSGLIIFADEGHGATKRSNRVLEKGHTLLFFEKHLK